MARKAKVDNALLKRLARKERKRKEAVRSIRQFILIVCEGEKTEPYYFEGFRKSLPRGVLENNAIEIRGEGRGTLSLIREIEKIRLRREKETGRKFDQTWAVFDKDSFKADNFNNAIHKAEGMSRPIMCAWSNEAFELWYCLHFSFVDHAMPRTDYKKRIEQGLSKAMGKPFSYGKNSNAMYQLLKEHGNQQQAIKWACTLENKFKGNANYALQNPVTKVHHLVQMLENL